MPGFGSTDGVFAVTHNEHFIGADNSMIPATWGLVAPTVSPGDIALFNNGMRERPTAVHAPLVYLLVSLQNTTRFKVSADLTVSGGTNINTVESVGVSSVHLLSAAFGSQALVGLRSPNPLGSPHLTWSARVGAFNGDLVYNGWDASLWFRMGLEVNNGTITWYKENTPRIGFSQNGPQNNVNMTLFATRTVVLPTFLYVGFAGSNAFVNDTSYNGVDELMVEEFVHGQVGCPSGFVNPVWPMPAEGEG